VYSNEVTQNTTPAAPAILFPGAGKTIYNTQPYVGLTISAEPDAQAQTLYYSVDGGASQNGGSVSAGAKKLRMPTLAAGAHTLRFWTQDSQGVASGQVSVTVTVAANTYARAIANHTKIWDQANGFRHVPEILQMLDRVNLIRAYYGLAPISLPYGETTGDDTIRHFHTWLANMQALHSGLAATCTVSGATLAALNTGGQKRPAPGVINQIRTAIGNL
jgi:pterin-4a-carbinolamine dehydratase